jgi:hypothetical protein
MRAQVIAAAGSGASFIASVAVPIAFPNAEPWVGYSLLAFAACLAALAFGLWWPHRKAVGEASSQTSHGDGAHNIGTVHGNVTIGAPVAPAAETSEEQRASYARIAARHHCPETPIFEAAAYLLRLGRSRNEVRLLLQQAFSDDRLSVWGRPETPPRHMQDPRIPGETWKPIQPSYWDEFRLTDVIFDANEDHPQTEARPHVMKDLLRRHWALRVSADQVKSEWPEPEPPKRPRPTGPNAWMAAR